jgi:hypothetical protein
MIILKDLPQSVQSRLTPSARLSKARALTRQRRAVLWVKYLLALFFKKGKNRLTFRPGFPAGFSSFNLCVDTYRGLMICSFRHIFKNYGSMAGFYGYLYRSILFLWFSSYLFVLVKNKPIISLKLFIQWTAFHFKGQKKYFLNNIFFLTSSDLERPKTSHEL